MEYRNARYADFENLNFVDCEINHPEYGWIPTTVPLDDSDPETQELRDQLLADNQLSAFNAVFENGSLRAVNAAEIAAIIAGVQNETLEQDERGWRNQQLTLADVEIYKIEDSGGDTTAWRAYRQQLRDYPQQPDFPNGTRPPAPV